eukprot:1026365-Amphidinium_carterae.1
MDGMTDGGCRSEIPGRVIVGQQPALVLRNMLSVNKQERYAQRTQKLRNCLASSKCYSLPASPNCSSRSTFLPWHENTLTTTPRAVCKGAACVRDAVHTQKRPQPVILAIADSRIISQDTPCNKDMWFADKRGLMAANLETKPSQ